MRYLVVAAVAVWVVGCARILSLDAYGDGQGGASSSAAVGGGGAGAAGGFGGAGTDVSTGVGGAGGVTCTKETTLDGVLVADSRIAQSGGCPGTITYGGDTYANIGAGRVLLRFSLLQEQLDALAGGSVTKLELHLYGDPSYSPLNQAGTLLVHPLRNTWVEGSSQASDGADWCRRTTLDNEQWDQPGAAGSLDIGLQSGAVAFAMEASDVVLDLDPAPLAPWVDGDELSLRVAAPTGVFVITTREHPTRPPPTLTMTICE